MEHDEEQNGSVPGQLLDRGRQQVDKAVDKGKTELQFRVGNRPIPPAVDRFVGQDQDPSIARPTTVGELASQASDAAGPRIAQLKATTRSSPLPMLVAALILGLLVGRRIGAATA